VPRSKNAWSYNPLPQYVFMAWCLVKIGGKEGRIRKRRGKSREKKLIKKKRREGEKTENEKRIRGRRRGEGKEEEKH
jgi:hypothetical protein